MNSRRFIFPSFGSKSRREARKKKKVNYLGTVADASVLNHCVFTAVGVLQLRDCFTAGPLKKRGGGLQRAVRLGPGRNLRVSVQRLSRWRRPLIL